MGHVRPSRVPFLCVWLGQMVSNVGSGLTGVALGFWVLKHASTVTDFSLLVLALQVPGFVLLPLAGTLADRWNRRTVMGLCVLGGIAGTTALLVLSRLDLLTIEAILPLAAVTFTCIAFHGPSYTAAITQIVPGEFLSWASGLTQLSAGITLLVTPVLGAILLQAIGMDGILVADLATFAFALAMLALVRIPSVIHSARPGRMISDLRAGWHYLRGEPGLLWLLSLLAFHSLVLGVAQTVLPPLVLKLYAGEDISEVSVLVGFSVGGLGLIVGGAVVALRRSTCRLSRGILVAELANAVGLTLLCWAGETWALAAALFLIFLPIPFSTAWLQVLVQVRVPAELQGRVVGCMRMVLRLSLPLGTLAAGPLADRVFIPLFSGETPPGGRLTGWLGGGEVGGLRALLLASGLAGLVVASVVFFVRRVRDLDRTPAQEIPAPEAA